MKHLPHPRTVIKSMCGLPFPGKRKDGRRHFRPELADVSTCIKCNRYNSMKKRHVNEASNGIAPVGAVTRR